MVAVAALVFGLCLQLLQKRKDVAGPSAQKARQVAVAAVIRQPVAGCGHQQAWPPLGVGAMVRVAAIEVSRTKGGGSRHGTLHEQVGVQPSPGARAVASVRQSAHGAVQLC